MDASVAVKLFLNEADSPAAAALAESEHELWAPSLIRVEVAAAITQRNRMGGIEDHDATGRLRSAWSLIAFPNFHLMDNNELLSRAGAIAIQLKHSFQDCLYVACAEHVGAELVTTDRKLYQRAAPHFDFVKLL